MSYFDRFPIITYNGVPVRNILARTRLSDSTKNEPKNFVPHKLSDSIIRPDLIANAYYDDQDLDWLVYFSNSVVDPYHDIYKNEENFLKYIEFKYGSLVIARDKIAFYRTNWATSEDSGITAEAYDALSLNLQKYYSPVIDYYNRITSYNRKEQDWIVSTNMIRGLAVDTFAGATIGDIFQQTMSNAVVAKGELIAIDETNYIMYMKNIVGTFVDTAGNSLEGRYDSSGTYEVSAVTNPSVGSNLLSGSNDNIPSDELVYWEAVTHYDNELELNELKRNIQLLRNSQKGVAKEQLFNLLRT